MRFFRHAAVAACITVSLCAQEAAPRGPTSEKAQKSYRQALEYLKTRMFLAALDSFKAADKQDGGHCLACQKNIIKYAMELGDWKSAETAAGEVVADAQGRKDLALAHYQLGAILMREGFARRKEELFAQAHQEMARALEAYANFPEAVFADGRVLAQLKQDEAAKAKFEQFVSMKAGDDPDRQRALRFINQPELARARMAPPFAIVTADGQRLSLDDLTGKVVLIDFWATWCMACREAMPRIRGIAKRFEGQPLVVLSVSLDEDKKKWMEFVAKNGMNWPQYRDSAKGPVARLFGVQAIPHTFTIDADGVLQDEQIGDASIEGKLKKLVSRAREMQPQPATELR